VIIVVIAIYYLANAIGWFFDAWRQPRRSMALLFGVKAAQLEFEVKKDLSSALLVGAVLAARVIAYASVVFAASTYLLACLSHWFGLNVGNNTALGKWDYTLWSTTFLATEKIFAFDILKQIPVIDIPGTFGLSAPDRPHSITFGLVILSIRIVGIVIPITLITHGVKYWLSLPSSRGEATVGTSVRADEPTRTSVPAGEPDADSGCVSTS